MKKDVSILAEGIKRKIRKWLSGDVEWRELERTIDRSFPTGRARELPDKLEARRHRLIGASIEQLRFIKDLTIKREKLVHKQSKEREQMDNEITRRRKRYISVFGVK